MDSEIRVRVGPSSSADGAEDNARAGRQLDLIVSELQGRYFEQTARGNTFSLVLAATTTGVAAGNIAGAAAAAATQFALINPAASGKNYSLLKFGMGIISGTPGAGPLFHGYIPNAATISAASPGGTARNNLPGGPSSAAIPWALAAGSALTGGQAPATLRVAAFSSTATAQASVGELNAVEEIAGEIVLPPGTAWLPLWGAAGTALLNAYSVTWAEVPV